MPNISSINFNYADVSMDGISFLLDILSIRKIELKEISLQGNENFDLCKVLESFIDKHPTLEVISLSRSNIYDDTLQNILNLLGGSKIHTLELNGNEITDKSLPILFEFIQNSNIKELDIGCNDNITKVSLDEFLYILFSNKCSLKTLQLDNLRYNKILSNKLESKGIEIICDDYDSDSRTDESSISGEINTYVE